LIPVMLPVTASSFCSSLSVNVQPLAFMIGAISQLRRLRGISAPLLA
jgi:hypothetical protein